MDFVLFVKKKNKYIFIGIAAFIISLVLFLKFKELRNTVVDVDGIGISLLGFEINDRVTKDKITAYANGFLAAALLMLLPVIYSISKVFK